MIQKLALIALVAPLIVAGCQSTAYNGGAPKLLAQNKDSGWGDGPGPRDGVAAVAITPDGCAAWIMDEGVEGYASTRSDPRTGLPVCTTQIPPGSVIGNPQVSGDFPDFLP
ncbi:MAG TPA: hypothetical protein DIU07_09945 [Rhodobacteraceae bacterium]|nr:hypothetical protein [Paracoccaceae bacterium]